MCHASVPMNCNADHGHDYLTKSYKNSRKIGPPIQPFTFIQTCLAFNLNQTPVFPLGFPQLATTSPTNPMQTLHITSHITLDITEIFASTLQTGSFSKAN